MRKRSREADRESIHYVEWYGMDWLLVVSSCRRIFELVLLFISLSTLRLSIDGLLSWKGECKVLDSEQRGI